MQILLKSARMNAKLTQNQIDGNVGVGTVTVFDWNSGKTELTITQYKRF